jgi:hypothetical protein
MDIRKALLFIAGQQYTNYSSININPGGLRKLGSADLVLKNLGLSFPMTLPSTFTDKSGNGNDGIIEGSPQPVVTPHGKGLRFAYTTDDRLTVNDSPTLRNSGGNYRTLELMVKLIEYPYPANNCWIFYMGGSGGNAFGMRGTSGSSFQCVASTDTDSRTTTMGTVADFLGEWHHLAMVYNGDDELLYPYIDGVMVGSGGQLEGVFRDIVMTGRINLALNRWLNEFAYVRLYNRALSQAEIQANMEGTVTREDLVLDWDFEDIISQVRPSFQDQLGETVIQLEDSVLDLPSELVDSTGNGNDLTPVNEQFNNVKGVYDEGEKAIYFRGIQAVQNYGYLERPQADINDVLKHFGDESWDSSGWTVLVDCKILGETNWTIFNLGGVGTISFTTGEQFQPSIWFGGSQYYTGGKGSLVAGARTHLVNRWDRANQLLEAWQDGVNLGTRDTPPDLPADPVSSYLRINHGWYGENIVYSVRVWKRPLSQAEILGLWNDKTAVPRNGLVAEWAFDDLTGSRKNIFRGYPVEMDETWPDIILSLEDFASFLKWRIIKYDHIYRQIRLGDIFRDLLEKYAPEISPGEIDPLLAWVRFCKVKEGYKLFDTFGELGRKFNVGFHVDADKVFHAFNLSTVGAAAYTVEEGENVEIGNLRQEFDKILSKAIMTCTLNKPLLRDEYTNDVPVDDWESSPHLLATLNPTDDSWVDEGAPTATHGSDIMMEAFYHKTSTDHHWALIKFDISAYDDFGEGCKLRVYCSYRRESSDTYYLKKATTDSWVEATVNWNTRPSSGARALQEKGLDVFVCGYHRR